MSAIHVVIPAGGAGTRLWPLSRRNRPKFLLDLFGTGQSMLQQTVLRLLPVTSTLTVVTGQAHVLAVRQQIEQLNLTVPVRILAEPSPRDSMAAIGFATYLLRQEFGEQAIVGSFAADHVIEERCTFLQTIRASVQVAERGFLTTIGLTPEFISTAYGYIQTGQAINLSGATPATAAGANEAKIFQVEKFVEKPSQALAKSYVSQGFLWNAGMFVFQTGTLAELLRTFLPKMDEGLQTIAKADGCPDFAKQVDETWPTLSKIAIDNALAEPASSIGRVAVVVAPRIGWSDIGDFAALSKLSSSNSSNPVKNVGSIVQVDATGGYIATSTLGKSIAILGLDNVVVIDSEDALLVTTTERAQEVKKVVDELQTRGLDNLL